MALDRFAIFASCSPKLEPIIGFPQIIWLAMKSSKLREWTELEVKTLISMSGQRHSADEISKCLGRYIGSVRTKARELGLSSCQKAIKSPPVGHELMTIGDGRGALPR